MARISKANKGMAAGRYRATYKTDKGARDYVLFFTRAFQALFAILQVIFLQFAT